MIETISFIRGRMWNSIGPTSVLGNNEVMLPATTAFHRASCFLRLVRDYTDCDKYSYLTAGHFPVSQF